MAKDRQDRTRAKGRVDLDPEVSSDRDDPLVLYQIVRDDLDSMNPGKAVAQGGHAATAMAIFAASEGGDLRDMLAEWAGDRGYGCAVCLAADEATLRRKVASARRLGLHAGLIVDPTYPLADGRVTHAIELLTAGFIFGRRGKVSDVVADLKRMP